MLDTEFHKDLQWISEFLLDYNGVDIIPKCPTYKHKLMVDSCLSGGGGHLGPLWYSFEFPDSIKDSDMCISQLEMWNAMIGIKLLAEHIQGHVIEVLCDNAAAVNVLQTGRARCPTLLRIAREVWRVTARYNIEISVSHVPGQQNVLADLLSRAHMSRTARVNLAARAVQCNAIRLPVNPDLFNC